jgi:hypothetical protein
MMSPIGTSRTSIDFRVESAKRTEADLTRSLSLFAIFMSTWPKVRHGATAGAIFVFLTAREKNLDRHANHAVLASDETPRLVGEPMEPTSAAPSKKTTMPPSSAGR